MEKLLNLDLLEAIKLTADEGDDGNIITDDEDEDDLDDDEDDDEDDDDDSDTDEEASW